MNKFKVLHFPLQAGLGGIRSYILQNWAHMRQHRIQFDIITRFEPDEELVRSVGPNGNIYPVVCPYAGHEREFLNRIEKIIDQGYDAIHLHTSNWFGGFPLEEMAVKKGIPRIIVHSHSTGIDGCYIGGDYDRLTQLHEHYKKQFTPALATDYLACSRLAGEWIFPACIPREKIVIMKNAVDTSRFSYKPTRRMEMRAQLEIAQDAFVVGAVSRFADQKNPFFLLEIFRAFHKRNPASRLVWVGSGPLMEKIREEMDGLKDAVFLLGDRLDVPNLMQAFDCMLMPSLFEGFPIVVVEAQAAGLPCFLSDTITDEVNLTELVRNFPLADTPARWAERMQASLSGFTRRDWAAEIAKAGYDIRTQAKELEQFYLEKKIKND